MKRPCDDCGTLKLSLTRCALCERSLCSYCYRVRHNFKLLTARGKPSKKKGCLTGHGTLFQFEVPNGYQ